MDQVLERITAWEDAGLIDPATAARLRLAEAERAAERPAASEQAPASSTQSDKRPSSLASIFGPGVTIGEMFAYLGGAFLLGAFEAFVIRIAGSGTRSDIPIAAGSLVAAIALGAVGRMLMAGDPRRRRAAGVMFALAVAHVGAFGAAIAAASGLEWPIVGVIGALFATVAGVGFRLLHPSMLTQVALLASVTSLAGVLLSWLEQIVVPEETFDHVGEFVSQGGPDPLLLVAFSAAWWLGLAVLVGVIGLREADAAAHDPSAGRRASLARLWAGLIAVIGLASSITRSDYTSTGEFHRVMEPWIGDLAILILAAILVERAFRREASTYVYAAALGFMIALSDFNFSYLTSSAELGLLVEGLILLAAGVAADRLRRRVGRPLDGSAAPDTPAPAGSR